MADSTVVAPTINRDQMIAFGNRLSALAETYEKDRRHVEQQWLKNARQFRGIYDPEILKQIPSDQSKAYPKITRTKVIGTIARLMEMLFPQTEQNYSIDPSPIPDLPRDVVQAVLTRLEEESGGAELESDVIERAMMEEAKLRAGRMKTQMQDQLDEMKYVNLVRRVVFSGVMYSAGLLKGPLVKKVKARKWRRDAVQGRYIAVEEDKLTPYFEVTPLWNWYPDLSAKTFGQMDGSFERHVLSRSEVYKLIDRPDFFADELRTWLRDHQEGNYRQRDWEENLRGDGDRKNVTDLSGRKYELWEWWGYVSGHELKAAGINVPEKDLHAQFEASVWIIDKTVVKCVVNPYEIKFRPYHIFIYEEDDANLLGVGLPQIMRDSQMAISEASRMLLDNASVICGPILEANHDLLMPGQSADIHAFKIFWREGQGTDAGQRAIQQVPVNGYLVELQSIIALFMSMADTETALPPPALGDVTKGGSEALRTTTGASMFLGAAALPIRDVVRNFDLFTESAMGSLYHWNMEFTPREEIKGDYTIVPRGSTSLIAKEVRAQSLDFFRASLSEDERIHVNTRKLLEERMKVRDLPIDLLDTVERVAEKQEEIAQEAARQQAQQEAIVRAQIQDIMSGVVKNLALANKANSSASNDTLKVLMEALTNAVGAAQDNGGSEEGGVGDKAASSSSKGNSGGKSNSSAGRAS